MLVELRQIECAEHSSGITLEEKSEPRVSQKSYVKKPGQTTKKGLCEALSGSDSETTQYNHKHLVGSTPHIELESSHPHLTLPAGLTQNPFEVNDELGDKRSFAGL